MHTIDNYGPLYASTNDVEGDAGSLGVLDGEVNDADAQAFMQLMQGQPGQPTEAELQEQFNTNFQNFSYLFLKGVFSYVEDEVRKQ